MNQIPNIEEVPLVTRFACRLAGSGLFEAKGDELQKHIDWLADELHQQLQKAREQTNQKWLSAIDEEIDDMNAQGSVFEEMTDRITSIALNHSELDQPITKDNLK